MYKEIIAFAGGVAVGVGIGYIIFDKKAKKRAEEEIASVKEYTRKKIQAMGNEVEKRKIDLSEIKEEIVERVENEIFEDDDEDVDLDDEESSNYIQQKLMSEEAVEHGLDGPVEISPDEFGELPINDEVTLLYYVDNDTLVTEEEEIVDDVRGTVGDILYESGFTFDDRQTIYIRNMLLGTDYEITKVFSSFEEES